MRALAPADVAVGRGGDVERHDLVAGRASVVGDHAVVVVQHLVHLVNHPVRRERGVVVREIGLPLGEPCVFGFLDADAHAGAAALFADQTLDGIDQRRQRELGVADQADVRGGVLVDLVVGDHRVDEELAAREALSVGRGGERCADREQHVAIVQPLARRTGGGASAGADRKRMAFVEGGLAGHRRVHGRVEQLGQDAQFVGGIGGHHAGAGPDQRFLGVHQVFGGIGYGPGGGCVERRLRRSVGAFGALGHGRHAHVRRHFHQHRPRPPGAQGMEGAPHHMAGLVRAGDDLDSLQHRLPGSCRDGVRTHEEHVQRIAARQRQNRHVVRIGLGQTADRVLRAGLGLHRHHAEALAIRHSGEAVCGHHRAALVPKGHRADALLRHGFDEGIGRIAGHPAHPFLLEDAGDVIDAVHGEAPWVRGGDGSGEFTPVCWRRRRGENPPAVTATADPPRRLRPTARRARHRCRLRCETTVRRRRPARDAPGPAVRPPPASP